MMKYEVYRNEICEDIASTFEKAEKIVNEMKECDIVDFGKLQIYEIKEIKMYQVRYIDNIGNIFEMGKVFASSVEDFEEHFRRSFLYKECVILEIKEVE